MKKLTSIALSAILASSMAATVAFAQEASAEVDTSNVVQVNVLPGLCTLADNPATNADAANNPLCFAEAYGTGRTTQGDAVTWENVTFDKDIKQVAIKCGYNLTDKPNTSTEFWLYLNSIEGEPLAKVSVTNEVGKENYTASSQIKDQIYRFADVDIKAGTYDVILVGETPYSGSFSQINFMAQPMDAAALTPVADALKAKDAARTNAGNVVQLNVLPELCVLADNAATNSQASNYALEFAPAYGTGRTTQGDAVTWEKVKFTKDVKQVAIKCGYNLSSKPNTSTEFWLYLNDIEGDPIAKVSVTNEEGKENYTKSSQIVDQIYRTADVDIKAGEYTIIVVGETENSGSISQVNFMYEPMDVNDAGFAYVAETKQANDKAKSDSLAKAKAEAAAKAKAEAEKKDDAEKAEDKKDDAEKADDKKDDAEKADDKKEDVKEPAADETATAPTTDDAATDATEEEAGSSPVVPVIIVVVVVAVIVIAAVVIKKKKQ